MLNWQHSYSLIFILISTLTHTDRPISKIILQSWGLKTCILGENSISKFLTKCNISIQSSGNENKNTKLAAQFLINTNFNFHTPFYINQFPKTTFLDSRGLKTCKSNENQISKLFCRRVMEVKMLNWQYNFFVICDSISTHTHTQKSVSKNHFLDSQGFKTCKSNDEFKSKHDIEMFDLLQNFHYIRRTMEQKMLTGNTAS